MENEEFYLILYETLWLSAFVPNLKKQSQFANGQNELKCLYER